MHRNATGRVFATLIVIACALACAHHAAANELWSDESGDRSVSFNTSFKWTTTALNSDDWSSATFWRLRAALDVRPATWLSARVAYEPWARVVSEDASAAGEADVLSVGLHAPYRIRQLSASRRDEDSSFSYGHELDRASVSASLGPADVTVGRQAIGWGRGLLFGAVDIFAPFSPLDSDREWRRGIDALRVRTTLTDLISLDVAAAFGESAEASAYVGRIHGYAGDVDGELFVGSRCEDGFYGASVSLPVLDAELHGEAAVFLSPEPLPAGGSFGSDDVALKTVVGGSRTFDIAGGLMLIAEYHYSGFGVVDIEEASDYFADAAFLERYGRGDSQVLGRHACAVQLSYGFASLTPFSATWVVSPVDGSGVIIPSVVWVYSDNITISANAYIAHGAAAEGSSIASEYGGTPTGGLVQINIYH